MFDECKLSNFQERSSKHFSSYGEIFIPASDLTTQLVIKDVEAQGKAIIKDTLSKLNIGHLISFGVISAPSMRAFASRNDEGYLIGLHAGSIFYLYNLSRAMLSCSRIFPFLGAGDESVEFDLDYRTTAIYAPINSFADLQNTTRTSVGYRLFHQMVFWLVSHELSHIMHGHVDFCRSIGTLSVISDPDAPYADEATVLRNHAFEIMADGSATIHSTSYTSNNVNFQNAWVDQIKRFEEVLPAILNIFSVAALLRAFSPRSDVKLPAYTHPSANVRFAAVASMHQLMMSRLKIPLTEAKSLLFSGPIDMCNFGFAHCGGKVDELGDWMTSAEVEAERFRLKEKADSMVNQDLRQFALYPIDARDA
ncbi:hypothetical protein ACFZ8E_05830 [Methylobacterium sp. HMF5984]|uniref:hypothetical protein n=1 Tax=Methylobacterium sp. HMF5984 TaxID=3367370 RepID=UPI00385349A1